MNSDSFIIYIKTNDISNDIAEDVETKFNTSVVWVIEVVGPKQKTKNSKFHHLRNIGY